MRMHTLRAVGVLLAVATCTGVTHAQETAHAGHAMGAVVFPVSCSAQAQVEFNRAVTLLHHMTYPQAREGFRQVAATDPGCAMAQWGIAMTLFQPLWPTRPRAAELQQGWEAVQKAQALKPPTLREQLFLATAEAFFFEPASSDYWLRIRRWEQASADLHAAFPDDPEAGAFYALALLATAPSDRISREHSDQAAQILLRIYQLNPDHPGAMHYLVHANDVPGRERESLEITRKYERVAPDNPHALHMPTHIYTRLGDWNAVIKGNLRAAQAALKYPAGDSGQFVWDEFPHGIEYLIYGYLQQGADGRAAAQLQRLRTTARLEPTFKTAFHLASTQSRYALERRDWSAAEAIVSREPATLDWDRFAWPEAITQFAHGLGAVHLGKIAEAEAAIVRLGELESSMRRAGEDLFARNIRVLSLELRAWTAAAQGQTATSLMLMEEAAELERSTPKHAVTPGPTLPADEQWGDLLMQQHNPAPALAAYRRSMALYPKRFNGLLGAARAASALNDRPAARDYYRGLIEVAGGGTRSAEVKEARRYIRGR